MVASAQILKFAERVAAAFDPQKIVLFGSHAYGVPREWSDVDVLVITRYEGKSLRKSMEIWERTRPAFPVDLLVRRPEEAARQYDEWDPLIREALDKGKVLYERGGIGSCLNNSR